MQRALKTAVCRGQDSLLRQAWAEHVLACECVGLIGESGWEAPTNTRDEFRAKDDGNLGAFFGNRLRAAPQARYE